MALVSGGSSSPSGTASGDLSGTYPGPTVAKVNGIAVTGTPSSGFVPTATSASAATWQAAGGGLPDPFVVTGTDPNAIVAKFVASPTQFSDLLRVIAVGPNTVLTMSANGAIQATAYNAGLSVQRTTLSLGATGTFSVSSNDGAGDNATSLTVSTAGLEVDTGSGFSMTLRTLLSGIVIGGTHAAPADGEISAGECCLWFDQTDGVGNTKLMAKGKSADGTVKTATVALLA